MNPVTINNATLHLGDCREVLRSLPDNSVQCVVTSPPYFNLRDYQVAGQIGLEPTPDAYVAEMVTVFREVRRVLRDDGVCWLNLGDSYSGGKQGRDDADRGQRHTDGRNPESQSLWKTPKGKQRPVPAGFKPKDLMMIPARVALALQSDGWWLRSEITWCKKAPMPESVTDRPTNATEKVFLLTKSAKYFYDAEAVKEESATIWNSTKQMVGKPLANQHGGKTRPECNQSGRNLRNFWLLGPDPFPGAHFAVMPRKLVEPCIMAGTSERGACAACGAPWRRILEKGLTAHDGQTQTIYPKGTTSNRLALLRQAARERGEEYTNQTRTVGWKPTCACNAPAIPCTVLDPFNGAGTTGLVAVQHGRRYVGIELNPDYLALSAQRLTETQRQQRLDLAA